MYSKQHCCTDLYRVKQDIRHIYNHGETHMTKDSMSKLKKALFILEDVEREIRHGNADTTDGESSNGSDGDGSIEPLHSEMD